MNSDGGPEKGGSDPTGITSGLYSKAAGPYDEITEDEVKTLNSVPNRFVHL